MKSKWLAYAASLLLTAVLVTASVFLPRALLQRQERGKLGVENLQGVSPYRSRLFPRMSPTPAPTQAPSPTETPDPLSSDQTKRLHSIFQLYENISENSTIQREPLEGEMNMKVAVKTSMEKLARMMESGAIPPLPDFPNNYDVNASMNSVMDTNGQIGFTYWNLNYYTNAKLAKTSGGISFMMDAQTGDILSIKMHVGSAAEGFHLDKAAAVICRDLRISGKLVTIEPEDKGGPESAVWIADEKILNIYFFLSRMEDSTTFSMNISTQQTYR